MKQRTESHGRPPPARKTPSDPARRKFLLAVPLLALTPACASRTLVYAQPRGADVVYVTRTPPPLRAEHRPHRPAPRAIWIGGYWRWTGVDYAWVNGYWEHHPRGDAWIPGHWTHRRRGWVWAPGHWR